MVMKYVFLFLFCATSALSQNLDLEKDTIQLQEVVLSKSKKLKIKTTSFRGPCYAPDNMADASEIITLVEKLPDGYLHSASFYFNEMALAYKNRPDNFRDTEFEVLLYKVKPDGTPGERMVYETLLIAVGSRHKGAVEVDLAGLAIENPGRLFIGLKKLNRQSTKNDFLIDCLCNGHDKYFTLYRNGSAEDWSRRWVCAALKIDIKVSRSN